MLEVSKRFLDSVDAARLAEKSKAYYHDGWRLLSATPVTRLRLEVAGTLRFEGSAANTNCALRTLRRLLHRAEEWKLIRRAPKIKLVHEQPRSLRLDEAAEAKLLEGAALCKWRSKRTLERFTQILILARDTGMRNEAGKFRQAREKAGLPKKLVLYCGRHHFGTRILENTGNLKLVMSAMGHVDVKTAMKYQHPELGIVRTALNDSNHAVLPPSA